MSDSVVPMSDPVVHRFTLDVNTNTSQVVVLAKVGDTNRDMRISFTEGGVPYKISGKTATLGFVPPGGNFSSVSSEREGEEIIWHFTKALTAVTGRVSCEVQIYSGANLLTSPRFTIIVDDTLYEKGSKEIKASAEYTAFVEQARWCVAARLGAAEAEEKAKNAAEEANKVADELKKAKDNGEFNGPKGDTGEKGDKGDKGDTGEVNINDAAIGPDAWSSTNIVEKLCPDFEKTGKLVQCNPVEGYPLTVFAKEDGDVEGVTVTVCGKNLYNREDFPITDGKYIVAAGGTTSSTGYACVEGFIPVTYLQGKKITLNHPPTETDGSAPRMVFYIAANATAESVIADGKTNSYTTTVPNNANYMRFSVPKKYADGTQIQIEVGETVTAYEPYSEKKFEESGDASGEFIPVTGVVGRVGVMTFYAKNGSAAETTEVKVSGKADPRAEISKLNDAVDKLTNAVISLGGNI